MQNSAAIFCFSPVYLFVEEEYLLFVEKDKKLFSYFVPRLFLLLLHSLVRISVLCLAFLSNQSHCPELVNLSYFLIKPITHPMANQSTNSFSKQPISHHHHHCCCFCLKKVKKYLYINVLTYMYVVAHVHGSFETLSQNLDAL